MSEWDILTKEDINEIQSSFAKLEGKQQETGDLLYKHLFECCPDVAKIFKGDMKEQAYLFMKMMKTVVDGLNNVHILMAALQQLGGRHHDYGVTPDQYKYFGDSLMFSLEKTLGKDFDGKVKSAWGKLYDVLEVVMKGNKY
jgi:hemoglobin-like flavoprotein